MRSGKASRETILDAALQTFARNGFDGASIPNIAKLAGVAPPLVHYYFETKDNLWRATVEYSLGGLRRDAATILKATASLAPLDRLRALLQTYAEFAARCPDHFSMIVAEARADSDRFSWLQENYTGVLFEEITTLLLAARDAGTIRDMPMNHLGIVLMGGILSHFTINQSQEAQPAGDLDAAGFVEFLFELLEKGAMA